MLITPNIETKPSTQPRKTVVGGSLINKTSLKQIVAVALLSVGILKLRATETKSANERQTPDSAVVAHWQSWRFGMFIHWGPVSLKETEISWSRANSNPKCPNKGQIPVAVYDNLYKEFNPTNFNAVKWVATAKAAGMKYMVLTAKHCDGFLLWDSKVDDYNIMHTPFKRDVCAELAKAAHEAGMKIGWYFSPEDWRDPDFRTERNAAFVGRMQAEIRELLSNYGQIDLLWFDWDLGEPMYDQAGTYALVKKLQPQILLNNRLDLGPGNSDRQILSTNADFYTPEQSVGGYDDQRPWESCMTVSAHDHWAWGGANDGVKSTAECLQMLINAAGGDGNVLLNVGPRPDGVIDPEQANRLKDIGAWLAKNGESIYGTRGGPWKPKNGITSTRNGNQVFIHVMHSDAGRIELPALPAEIKSASLLNGDKVECSQKDGRLVVAIPPASLDAIDTVVKLELDRPALEIPALIQSSKNGQ